MTVYKKFNCMIGFIISVIPSSQLLYNFQTIDLINHSLYFSSIQFLSFHYFIPKTKKSEENAQGRYKIQTSIPN